MAGAAPALDAEKMLYTKAEAAAALGTSERAIDNARRAGDLVVDTLGRYALADLCAFAGLPVPAVDEGTIGLPKLLYSRAETAHSLAMSLRAVDQLRIDSEVEVVYIGDSPKFPTAELRRYVLDRPLAA